MYSRNLVSQKLQRSEQVLGFPITYHSYGDIQDRIQHLNSFVSPDTPSWRDRKKRVQLARPLKKEDIEWIRNERAICTHDFLYYCQNYARILFNEKLIPFNLNTAQRIVLDIWAEHEDEEREIAMQQSKARQLGVSTLTEIAINHRVNFLPSVNALVASSSPQQSEKMAKMMERVWENLPWWMTPFRTRYVVGELIDFQQHGSGVSIQSGNQFVGFARGDTPTAVHLSEVVDYQNPGELIDASLLRCVHAAPNIFLVFESTSKGLFNYWHEMWLQAVEGYFQGKFRLRPLFLPWFIGRELYPTPTWLRERPVPANWKPLELTIRHAERAREYVRRNVLLQKHLGSGWQMPIEQMWYWEVEREAHRKRKLLAQFLSEMPADPEEMFQSTNISVFDVDCIAEHRDRSKQPVSVYAVMGNEAEIPPRLYPSKREFLTQKECQEKKVKSIEVCADWHPNERPSYYQLVPLRFEGIHGYDWSNKLFVYEEPRPNCEYAVGIDTADGVGQDRSVIEVIRKGTLYENDAQCAEYASAYLNAYDLWPIAMAIGTYYSVKCDGKLKQPKMVIECRGNGETTQLELKKRGWNFFHAWVRYDNKKIRSNVAHKIGWYTNVWSRPMMMDFLVKLLRDFDLDIHSPWFVNEMVSLSKDWDAQDMRADYGGFDDRIMALGIALFSLHALHRFKGARSLSEEREAYEKWMGEVPQYTNAMGMNAALPLFRNSNQDSEVIDITGRKWDKKSFGYGRRRG